MKVLKFSFYSLLLIGLTSCGGGSSNSNIESASQNGLSGLSECEASNAEQTVVCGTVLANDGVTPLVNAEVKLATAARGVSNDNKCLTDEIGDFVCLLPEEISGSVDLVVTLNGFENTKITTNVRKGEITETASQNLIADTTEKWVVIPGIYDGVQVLLAQLKGCTLSGPNAEIYTSAIAPSDARGSADCESKGLIVLDYEITLGAQFSENTEAITSYLASNELLDNDSLFVNDDGDYSTPEIDALLQAFVSQGGDIYFSDLSSSWLTKAFPDKINVSRGITEFTEVGTIAADVKIPGLASLVGDSVNIVFDEPGWDAVESVAAGVITFIEGNINSVSRYNGVIPISMGWKETENSGCVFFTSYHIEGASQGAPQELAMKYLLQNIDAVCK